MRAGCYNVCRSSFPIAWSRMLNFSKPINRVLFLLCVIVTGAVAGAFVWAFFFLMGKGISFLWATLPMIVGQAADACLPGLAQGPFGFLPYPIIVCVGGGLLIGYFDKKTGARPEGLTVVMGKVRQDGRYSYNDIGKLSLAALLPLVFGGSIGPEAGLTGVIAGLCTWVGDRMRRFGADFRALTTVGTQAALTALFTAPLYGFVAPLAGTADAARPDGADVDIRLPRAQKALVYLCAVAGTLGAFLLLGDLFGGNVGLPRFAGMEVGLLEAALVVPAALAGCAAGWVFHASNWASRKLAERMGERPVAKGALAGLVLAACGMALPYTMFAGEAQCHMLMETYFEVGAGVLVATGFVKAAITPFCIQMGWRGGHFFPLIFAGVSIGYGLCLLSGADPTLCVAACTAGCMGAVMRQPVMTALLLVMCFPVKGVVVMMVAAAIGAAVPLPKAMRSPGREKARGGSGAYGSLAAREGARSRSRAGGQDFGKGNE